MRICAQGDDESLDRERFAGEVVNFLLNAHSSLPWFGRRLSLAIIAVEVLLFLWGLEPEEDPPMSRTGITSPDKELKEANREYRDAKAAYAKARDRFHAARERRDKARAAMATHRARSASDKPKATGRKAKSRKAPPASEMRRSAGRVGGR